MNAIRLHTVLVLALTAMLFGACSSEKSTSLSLAYHNTASHYNSYYYARENIRQVQEMVNASVNNDFDEILPIFPDIDSTLASSYQEQIDEAIKMASISIQRHPASKWVDDNYLLIGLARYYSLDFVNAIQTFKYINTNSDDDDTRHRALIYLHRTFTDYGEYENAVAVSDYLNKEDLNTQNQKLLYIYRAYYYQVRGDLDNMLTNLVNAAPTLRKKDGPGRMYFIIAQNYQELGFGPEAYNYYKKCLSTNPPYEFDFYSRLNMTQVAEIENASDIRDARKSFERLLNDQKNREFRDKIYYEMAEFEMRQGNLEEALAYYRSSVGVSERNRKQKGLSYLALGRIHYDTLRNYRLAQAYYDSSLTVLPTDFENYRAIAERSSILTEFVNHLTTIETQDSLLNLARMDSMELNRFLTAHVEEVQARARAEDEARRERLRSTTNVFDTGPQAESASWYFGNPTAMAMGKTEFQRVWGDLPLEDDWRRSYRDNNLDEFDEVGDTRPDDRIIATTETANGDSFDASAEVASLRGTIPSGETARREAHSRIEEAYFKVGNIYYFQLDESRNAAESFETLLNRYDTTSYKVESMYLLYLIYKDLGRTAEMEKYRDEILTNYPTTTFARLIVNPNYTQESSIVAEKLKVLYDSAYDYYTSENFEASRLIIDNALGNFEDLQISRRFKLLDILITGKTENITQYQFELAEFIKANPDSELTPYAQQLLESSREFEDRMMRARGVKFIEHFTQEHYVIISYKPRRRITDELTYNINSFNQQEFPDGGLQTSNLIMGEDYYLTMISEFPGAKSSLVYYEKLKANATIQSILGRNEFDIFSITKENFEILYQTEAVDSYMKFFNENY